MYDISIPCKPNFIHNVPFSGAAKIEIIDNYMLVPGSPDVTIYLLDDPSTPVEISSFQENLGDQGYSGEDLDKLGDFITIASSDEGFYLVKFDGFNLEHLQTFRLTRNNDIALGASLLPNNLLVLSSFQAIMVYNISDPNAPTLIVEKEL